MIIAAFNMVWSGTLRRTLVFAITSASLLTGCIRSNSEKAQASVAEIKEGIKSGDQTKLMAAAAAIDELTMSDALEHDSKGPQECYVMNYHALQIFKNGAEWYAKWLQGKSEAKARSLWEGNSWVDDTSAAEAGSCGDPAIESLRSEAAAFATTAKPTALSVFPNLEKAILAEREAQWAIAQRETKVRWVRCELNVDELQQVFDQFVRLEDRNGKDNEVHEAIVAEVFETTPDCIHRSMVRALNLGIQPPAL